MPSTRFIFSRQLIVLLAALCVCSMVVAFPDHFDHVHYARNPAPSKRFASPVEPRAPAPSKRVIARAPAPSKRFDSPIEARAPAPSKRHIDGRAPAPLPSKRFEARAPVPSKRYEPSYPAKRSVDEQETFGFSDVTLAEEKQCPTAMSACPITGSVSNFECVDFTLDLTSCGGCSIHDVSHDCTAIPGADIVSCASGNCRIHSCIDGFTLSTDKTTCIEN